MRDIMIVVGTTMVAGLLVSAGAWLGGRFAWMLGPLFFSLAGAVVGSTFLAHPGGVATVVLVLELTLVGVLLFSTVWTVREYGYIRPVMYWIRGDRTRSPGNLLRRHDQRLRPSVSVNARTAELIGRLAQELHTDFEIRDAPSGGTAISLLNPETGEPLLGRADRSARTTVVAIVPSDSTAPIMAYLEPVPDTAVAYGGDLTGTVVEVATRLIDHYRPAGAARPTPARSHP